MVHNHPLEGQHGHFSGRKKISILSWLIVINNLNVALPYYISLPTSSDLHKEVLKY